MGCDRLPEAFHGKEGVSGSSPEEGFTKTLQRATFHLTLLLHDLQPDQVWSTLRDREAIDVGLDVLSALEAIHPDSERLDQLERKKLEGELTEKEYAELMAMSENALVHRDIKPQNIMLTRSGARLLDFNIASRVGDPVRTVSGTPPYQAPDANLTRWDVSTDLFAVGVTLYELLCDGNHPYEQSRPTAGVEPRDPRHYRRDMNEGLAAFLLRACAPDRSKRFHTAAEMKGELQTVRASV
jgi:serine/threonine protein kinase